MDQPPEQQPDLLAQRPREFPTITIQEVDQQCQDLRTLLMATFVALLVLSLSLNLFLAKQMKQVRNKVSESRKVVQRMQAEFQKKEPNMKSFINALQSFAAANRDFQPVLEKYKYALPQYLAAPAAVSTAPPGIAEPPKSPTGVLPVAPSRPAGK
jgi:hypothetical protein